MNNMAFEIRENITAVKARERFPALTSYFELRVEIYALRGRNFKPLVD